MFAELASMSHGSHGNGRSWRSTLDHPEIAIWTCPWNPMNMLILIISDPSVSSWVSSIRHGTWWNMMEHDGTWWNMMEHDGTWWNMHILEWFLMLIDLSQVFCWDTNNLDLHNLLRGFRMFQPYELPCGISRAGRCAQLTDQLTNRSRCFQDPILCLQELSPSAAKALRAWRDLLQARLSYSRVPGHLFC